jgi:hypothetical protein
MASISISILPIHQIHPLAAADSLTATKHPIPLSLNIPTPEKRRYRNVTRRSLRCPVAKKKSSRFDVTSGLDDFASTLRIRFSQGSTRNQGLPVQISQPATNDDESVK